MKTKKKLDWKVKLVVSILCGALLIIGLLFGITYSYFVKKITANNEKLVHMTFQQTEKDLKNMLENTERQLNIFSERTLTWGFSGNRFASNAQRSSNVRDIIGIFDDMRLTDPDIYGVGILSGDGRSAISTAERISRTGETEISDSLKNLLQKAKDNYPYVMMPGSKHSVFYV